MANIKIAIACQGGGSKAVASPLSAISN